MSLFVCFFPASSAPPCCPTAVDTVDVESAQVNADCFVWHAVL